MTQTLRDEMAERMPGLRWTPPIGRVATGWAGKVRVARVILCGIGHECEASVLNAAWYGNCKSPAHAAKTIRRKLREFRDICDKALEETG